VGGEAERFLPGLVEEEGGGVQRKEEELVQEDLQARGQVHGGEDGLVHLP